MGSKTTKFKVRDQRKSAPTAAAVSPINQEIRRAHAVARGAGVAAMSDQSVSLTGRGVLIVDSETRGPVEFEAKSLDEMAPTLMELKGGSELLPRGTCCETVHLEIAGSRIKTQVIGWRKDTEVILVKTESVFRGLAKAVKAQW